MRFFQQPLPGDKPELISELAKAVGSDPKLLEDYKRVSAFYAKLTNPLDNLTLVDVHERGDSPEVSRRSRYSQALGPRKRSCFAGCSPAVLPPGADLMKEMIKAIRKGNVDLAPKPEQRLV